jgi:DNA-binding CsgD family transcriptional regulator
VPSASDGAALWASLSKRERSIAIKFAEGLTYQQIGEALFVAPTTVRTHLAAIYRKLDVHNKAALINLANAQSAPAAAPSQGVAPCPSVSLPARAKPTPTPRPALKAHEAERRQLTVMFVDLIGSTELSARLDPEDLGKLLRTYRNAITGQIDRYGGHVAKFMGDGVLAYFGWPLAHEDDAERAVRAGLALAASVARLPSPVSKPLACRIGIATGLVVVGELIGEGSAQEEAVHGQPPNLAARLHELATWADRDR